MRQAADVDDVNHRIREYEQGFKSLHSAYTSLHDLLHELKLIPSHFGSGRNEFTPTEDAHVIGDCLKVHATTMLLS